MYLRTHDNSPEYLADRLGTWVQLFDVQSTSYLTKDTTNYQHSARSYQYSTTSGSTVSAQDEYIKVLVNEIRQDLSYSECNRMKEELPVILEEFALRLGSEGDNAMFRNMMHIAHKMRKYVPPCRLRIQPWER